MRHRAAHSARNLLLALMLGATAVAPGFAAEAGDQAGAETGELYSYRPGSRDGIGKWYMGREISHVM
ncbi:MAG: hypothetical protein AAGL66_18335, partial [Pseudomonadota bacterium]